MPIALLFFSILGLIMLYFILSFAFRPLGDLGLKIYKRYQKNTGKIEGDKNE